MEVILNSEIGDNKLKNSQGESLVSWPWNWSPKRVESEPAQEAAVTVVDVDIGK